MKEESEKNLISTLNKQKRKAIYERAIYIIPYTSKRLVDLIQNAFVQLNLEGIGRPDGSEKDVNTHFVSKLESADRGFDVLSGFELIDFDQRMYVFEGLSNGAMSKIE